MAALTPAERQRRAIAHTQAEVAWQDYYRKRRTPARTSRGQPNRSVVPLNGNVHFHFTKGIRGGAL